MRIAVFGSGYVGLVTGACFSDFGNQVTLVDIDAKKVAALQDGKVPIYEPGLEEMVLRNNRAGRLHFTTDAPAALKHAEVIFVAVNTPEGRDGTADLSFVETVATTVAENCAGRGRLLFVLKSTVPVGTADICRRLLPANVEVVNNPEFLKEGSAVADFLRPERVVVGTDSPEAREVMKDLYLPFCRTGAPILFMSNRSAEVSKYAANSFLAMKVSYINDLAIFAESVGADIYDVRSVMTTDSRIGSKFLHPGAGYGGSCFPKDVQALSATARNIGITLPLIDATHAINLKQRMIMPHRIKKFVRAQGKDTATIALWGVAFKPETDDIREAPALVLIDELVKEGFKFRIYDPQAKAPLERQRAPLLTSRKVEWCDSSTDALKGADLLAVMTEWNEFRSPDFKLLHDSLKLKAIFDGKNIYRESTLERYGLKHFGIGLKAFAS